VKELPMDLKVLNPINNKADLCVLLIIYKRERKGTIIYMEVCLKGIITRVVVNKEGI
jgi:hypothetical protein